MADSWASQQVWWSNVVAYFLFTVCKIRISISICFTLYSFHSHFTQKSSNTVCDGEGEDDWLMEPVPDENEFLWPSRQLCHLSLLRPAFSWLFSISKVWQMSQRTIETLKEEKISRLFSWFLQSSQIDLKVSCEWTLRRCVQSVGILMRDKQTHIWKKRIVPISQFFGEGCRPMLPSVPSAVRTLSTKRNNVFLNPSFADLEPICNASESSSSAVFKRYLAFTSP